MSGVRHLYFVLVAWLSPCLSTFLLTFPPTVVCDPWDSSCLALPVLLLLLFVVVIFGTGLACFVVVSL